MAHRRAHGEGRHSSTTTCTSTRRSASTSSAASSSSGTDTATQLDILSVGGTIANRFDSRDVTYLRQLGNLQLEFPTDEIALFAQDAWKIRPNFTINYGLRWEGASNPTPEANNDFMLNAVQGFTSRSARTVDPTQIPDQLSQFGPRVGFAWDLGNDGRTVVRGYTGIYYARTPALLWAAPMNNFRVPPATCRCSSRSTVPAEQSEQHRLRSAEADRHRSQHARRSANLPMLSPDQLTQVADALGLCR